MDCKRGSLEIRGQERRAEERRGEEEGKETIWQDGGTGLAKPHLASAVAWRSHTPLTASLDRKSVV